MAANQWRQDLRMIMTVIHQLVRLQQLTSLTASDREGNAGASATCKNLMLIALGKATNVSNYKQPLTDESAKDIEPVSKRVFVDLLDSKWNLAGHNEKNLADISVGEV